MFSSVNQWVIFPITSFAPLSINKIGLQHKLAICDVTKGIDNCSRQTLLVRRFQASKRPKLKIFTAKWVLYCPLVVVKGRNNLLSP